MRRTEPSGFGAVPRVGTMQDQKRQEKEQTSDMATTNLPVNGSGDARDVIQGRTEVDGPGGRKQTSETDAGWPLIFPHKFRGHFEGFSQQFRGIFQGDLVVFWEGFGSKVHI